MRAIFTNPIVIYPTIAWAFAQGIKLCIHYLRNHEMDWSLLIATGGMPSSHSAYVCSAATAIAFRDGLNSSIFALAVVFAAIVMADAAGLRRAAGNHATILNQIVEELFQGHPINEEKLKELLGHTPTQVVLGAILGVLCSMIGMQWIWSGL
jgi:acid phosphatase family membrane protein YuiD